MPNLEEMLTTKHAESGRNLKKVVASKGKLQGNLYFAGDGKKSHGVIITLTARDPKGQKALTGGKALRKEIKSAKFARGTVIMDGGKLVVELFAGTATAAMLKKAFKDDAFRKDPALKLLARSTVKKKGAPGQEDEVEEGSGLSQSDLNIANDAFESRGFWRTSELKELMAAQGDLSRANQELQKEFFSIDSVRQEMTEQNQEIENEILDLRNMWQEASQNGDQKAMDACEYLISVQEAKLAENQSTGPDPFATDVIPSSITNLMDRVQNIPLQREALQEAQNNSVRKAGFGMVKNLFGALVGGSTQQGISKRANDALFDAEQREHFEKTRLEMDTALQPLVTDNTELERLVSEGDRSGAKSLAERLLQAVTDVIERAQKHLEEVQRKINYYDTKSV